MLTERSSLWSIIEMRSKNRSKVMKVRQASASTTLNAETSEVVREN